MINAGCKDYGRHQLHTMLLFNVPVILISLEKRVRFPDLTKTKPQNILPERQEGFFFVCVTGVQNIKHSEATFALLFFFCSI